MSIDDIAKLYHVEPKLLSFLKEPGRYQPPENAVLENVEEFRREWEKILSLCIDSTGVTGTSIITEQAQ